MIRGNKNIFHRLTQNPIYGLNFHPKYGKRNILELNLKFCRDLDWWRLFYRRLYSGPKFKRNFPLNYREYRNNPNLSEVLNKGQNNDINLKIKEAKRKIKEEIESRRNFLQRYLSNDETCFIIEINKYYRLKTEFLNYLLKKSDYHFVKKWKFKKKLENIRFIIDEGAEDLLTFQESGLISRMEQLKSVLKSDSSQWKNWDDFIRLIGQNIEQYKLSIKKEELKRLYDEYERMTYLEPEENVIICEKCGSENIKKAVYCHNCGNKL